MNATSTLPTLAEERDCVDSRSARAIPISVCHIASGDAWFGAEAQVANLVRELSRRRELAVSAIVLNHGRLAEELASCGIDVKVISEREKTFSQVVAEAHSFVRSRNAQILHSHRYKENLISALLRFADRRISLVRTQHGRPEALKGREGVKQSIVHTVDRVTARYACDKVIGVSSQLSSYLHRYISSQKVVTIPNGIDLGRAKCTLTRAEAKRRLHTAANEPVVGFVGRLERVKRLDLFVETAKHLADRLSPARFLVVGTGREESRFRELVLASGLDNRFLRLGHRTDTNDLLRAMDLLLITSDHEGMPMVLLEAMALGTPVVARAVGGIPEVLTDNQTGWLVSSEKPEVLAEVCLRVLEDDFETQRISHAAREVVERQYSAARNADQVLKLYRSLSAGHSIGELTVESIA
jgi:L-malate glycosyltransferase